MLRAIVVVFHLALSLALGFELAIGLVQARLNLLWEQSFYGVAAATTLLVSSLTAFALALTVGEFALALAWALRRRGTGTALILVSGVLLVFVTPEVGWALVAMGLAVGVEEIRSRLPPWEEIFSEDGEDP